MEQEPCNTSLGLGLVGAGEPLAASRRRAAASGRKPPVQFHVLFPACTKEEEEEVVVVEHHHHRGRLAGGEEQGISRLRLRSGEEEEEEDMVEKEGRESSGGGGNAIAIGGSARKKLRLTKEQSALLEDSFRDRNTLTPTQKQELAHRLNLRPRQVEVWFQNRRARTKLKQTEVDCEFLKKCCESLSDENRRLKRELQELRSIKPGPPFYVQLPKAATLTMCPSCETISAVDVKAAAKPRFFNCAIKDSSMAC